MQQVSPTKTKTTFGDRIQALANTITGGLTTLVDLSAVRKVEDSENLLGKQTAHKGVVVTVHNQEAMILFKNAQDAEKFKLETKERSIPGVFCNSMSYDEDDDGLSTWRYHLSSEDIEALGFTHGATLVRTLGIIEVQL
jgi:hypothetical protein